MTPCKFAFLVQVTNTLAVASKRGYNNFVCTCIKTNSTTELNQKLQKARPEDAQNGVFTQGKNTYVSGRPRQHSLVLARYPPLRDTADDIVTIS